MYTAPIENQYALKWTYEKTMDRLFFIQKQSCEENVIYLGEALMLAGVHPNIWSYWRRKWCDNIDIIEMMDIISHTFEVKIFKNALERKIHAGVAIFALKHHYKWSDRKPVPEPLPAEAPAPEPPQPPIEETPPAPPADTRPLTESCISDTPPHGKDFRPRTTDTEQQAIARARAARQPERHWSIIPPNLRGNYMQLAEDLYKTLY